MKNVKAINSINKNAAKLTALFASFVFLQFVVLRFGNQAGRGYLAESRQETVYGFLQVFVIIGFFVHAFFKAKTKSVKTYGATASAVTGLCLICAMIMTFLSPASAFYLAVTAVGVFALGYTGGAVYLYISSQITERLGLCIGCGYSIALLMQYLLQLRWTVKPLLCALIILSVALIIIILMNYDNKNENEVASSVKPYGKKLLFGVIITLALLLFITYYNSYIHHLQIASGYTEYNVYSWPRLVMIPGMLIFGFIGDYRGGKYLPLSALCVAVIAFLNAALIGKETYFINMCLFYLSLTAVITFYHLTFLRLAPDTKRPEIWAGLGRMLDSVAVIISFVFGFAGFSQLAVFIIDLSALIIIVILMAIGGDFSLNLSREENTYEKPSLEALKEKYNLTPSEFRVFKELVLTDDKQEVIASRLNISVSTLRHHITSIYKKTGTQTRSALCKLNASKQ